MSVVHAALDMAPAFDDGFAELWRPCLRHVELEVDMELVDPELADPWFANGETVERAVALISLGDDEYLPEPRSYRLPIAVGVGIAAAAAALLVVSI